MARFSTSTSRGTRSISTTPKPISTFARSRSRATRRRSYSCCRRRRRRPCPTPRNRRSGRVDGPGRTRRSAPTNHIPVIDRDLRRALRFIVPYWRRLALVLALSFVSTALSLYLPLLSRDFFDHALIGKDTATLVRVAVLFSAVTIASFA